MCVCVYVRMHLYVSIVWHVSYVYVYAYVYVCMCTCVCVHRYLHVACMCTYRGCVHVRLRKRACMYICMHVCKFCHDCFPVERLSVQVHVPVGGCSSHMCWVAVHRQTMPIIL